MKAVFKRTLMAGIVICAILAAPAATAQASNRLDSVTLAWNPNEESDLVGYRLYFSQNTNAWSHVQPVGLVTTTTVVLPAMGTWFFTLTATNTAGLESPPSPMVQYTTPTAPGKPAVLRLVSAVVSRVSSITTTTNLVYVP